MDKYEYRLKAEQVEKLANKKDYETAAKIADTIDWRRVKNLNMLYIVSDVYEAMERYEDCMEILNIAYDKASVGRMLLYKMTEIATKMHQFEEAIALYREFVKVAPHDQSRYILKYQIYRERGSAIEDQIRILKDYKAHEYQEKWAYELASLYAEAGMTEECVRECDELILWFSEGDYVRKAMELKMQYAPLTAAQQEKYEHSDKPTVSEDDFEGTEVDFNADKFSTMNLQAELAANLDELLQTDEEEIDIPDLETLPETVGEEKAEEPELEELDLALDAEPEEMAEQPESEEVDIPELDELDMDLEAEVESEEIPEAESVELPELEEDLPELEPLEDPAVEEEDEEEPLELESLELESLETAEEPEAEPELEELPAEPETEPELEELPEELENEPEEEEPSDELLTIPDVLAEWEQKKAETEARLEANAKQEEERKAQVMQKTAELMKLISGESEEIPQDVRDLLNEIEQEKKEQASTIVTEDDLPVDTEAEDDFEEEEGEALEDLTEQIQTESEVKSRPEPEAEKVSSETASLNMIQDLQNTMSLKVAELAVRAGHLSREQARVFSYFATVKGMGKQLSGLLKGEAPSARSNSSKGNVVITGSRGNGKTTLAIDIVKALQKEKRLDGHKLAKISGSKLNSKDIQEVLSKLKGGALIIENAGSLESGTLMALSLAMEGDTGGLLLILEGTDEDIQKIFLKNKNFASKFDYRVEVPVFSNEELVNFAKSYAMENGYSLDEFAVLALYDRIGSRQTLDNNVTVTEVKEILDEAMEHAEKGGMKRFFAKMTKKNIDENGNTILREEDFEEV